MLSSVLGPFVSIARHKVADKPKDENKKMPEQIDRLLRKDLLASYCFFKEGVVTLNLALDEVDIAQNGGSKTTTTTANESDSKVLNEASLALKLFES